MTKKLLILSTICLILTAIACSADTPTVRHTVTFLNADNSVFHKIQVEDGQTVNPPTEDPIKAEYLLKGWTQSLEGTELFDFATPIKEDITLFPIFVSAMDPESNLVYIKKEDGTLSVKRFLNQSGMDVLIIPSAYEGMAITSIESQAFIQFLSNEIHIPASISSIGAQAFLWCKASLIVDEDNTNYTAVDGVLFNKDMTTLISCPISKSTLDDYYYVPDSVTAISDYAFFNNYGLTGIYLPKGIQEIGACAFSYCFVPIILDEGNQKYTFENGVLFNKDKTTLISFMIWGISSYTVPESVTSIADYAFSYCDTLKEIRLPKGIISIGECAFTGCNAEIILDDETTEYSLIDGVLFNKDMTTLISCPKTKEGSYIVPATVTKLADGAFLGCNNLKDIVLHATLTEIGASAFSNTGSLVSIIVDGGNNSFASDNGVLFDKNKTILIHYPEAKAETSYTIPDSVVTISESAFSGTKLESLIIPDSVTTIGNTAFMFAQNLKSIEISDNVTTIPFRAFDWCVALESVTLPSNLISIEARAFSDCHALSSITIPESVESISNNAFEYTKEGIVINVSKPKDSIPGAPWGAENATVIWNQD